ncbi:MAG: PfkB family carbohydrate kinase [Candidatus Roizmanbacteria bacterium]|nr:PfkB family carbohydrate kinase [Candidatus Roizmanbacteria bacterium]
MNTYKNVYVTGSIAYDTIMDFPGEFKDYLHPEKLHQINISFSVKKLEKQMGGTGTNIAYNIKHVTCNMKHSNVYLLGSIGKDGQEFMNFFKKNKIDVSGIVVDKHLYSSAGSVITDKKDNQIWGFYYGASEKIPHTDFGKLNKKTDLLVISANHKNSFLYFQKEAIKNKISYFYDPGMTLTWIKGKDLEEGVLNCQYLIGNDYEIAMILKRLNVSINQLIDTGIHVITTLGEEGVQYYDVGAKRASPVFVKAFKVEKMIDPTGAGDAWRGGFVAGLLMNYSIRDCLKLGNVMASFAIEKYGTVNHRPTKKEIEKRMERLKS